MFKYNRKTKIVATLGPSSSSPSMIARLISAGVNVFRLNFSHGRNDDKKKIIELIRNVAGKRDATVAILADLQGPKIRTGKMENGAVKLDKNDLIEITTEPVTGTKALISTVYEALPQDVKAGSKILMDDGLLELKVLSVTGKSVKCLVVEGGLLKDSKGINLPGVAVSAPSLTEKDIADLHFALSMNVDYIALSFVRRAEDLADIKRIITEDGKHTPVVAKIEKPEAIRNFAEILKASDAIMVARGDLGVEIPAEQVPMIQKEIIAQCNKAGKPVITATQMLESMIIHPRPTRAETSDVANAILDGTDAIMLSGETASGSYPVEAVKTMVKIALDVEKFVPLSNYENFSDKDISDAVAASACRAAKTVKAKALLAFTQSGSTAALMSKYRPDLPVIALTPSPEIMRKLSLYRGVTSFQIGKMRDTDEQTDSVEQLLLNKGFKIDDIVIITMGVPLDSRGSTNLMKVLKLKQRVFCDKIQAL